MDDFLKSVVLGLGIFFGVLKPDVTPALQGRLYRTDDQLLVSFEIVNGLSSEAENLILSGNTLELDAVMTLNGKRLPGACHRITYNLKDREFVLVLGEHGSTHRTSSKDAAFLLFREFVEVPIIRTALLEEDGAQSLSAEVSLRMPDDSRFDPMVLWNYTKPGRTWRWNRLTEIPR